MKIRDIIIMFMLPLAMFCSCESMDECNTDPTRMSEATPGSFLNPTLYGMACYNWNRFDDFTFQLMQELVSTSSTNGVGWYHFRDDAGAGTWSNYYKWLNNSKRIYDLGVQTGTRNYQAIGLTLEAWILELLTESFGDVPVREACLGDSAVTTPQFDSQEEAFGIILNRLAVADTLFTPNDGLRYNSDGDMMYCTSSTDKAGIGKWRKFANSLRLRCLLRLINVPGMNAAARLREICGNPSIYPVIDSNDDNAAVSISGIAPEEQPMKRLSDLTSYLVYSEFFINRLKSWDDPRLPLWATSVTVDGQKDYVGVPSGYDVLLSDDASKPIADNIAKAPMKLQLMTYSEVLFIKAELAQRGIIDGSAQSYYEDAVRASMEQWGVSMPDGYFDNPLAAYDGTLERIMQQKYYALFFVDYQQWFEYNRTGYPDVPVGKGVSAGDHVPTRFKYPTILQRTNPANYDKAKEAMGGDTFYDKLIWQK